MKFRIIIFLSHWLSASLLIAAFTAVADEGEENMLILPPVFSNHMVLQREQSVSVWGQGVPDQDVIVTLGGEEARTRVDTKGSWQLRLQAQRAGGPFVLKVQSGSEVVSIRDVYLGDVWLMAGQSNMAFRFRHSKESEKPFALDRLSSSLIRAIEIPKIVAGGQLLDRKPSLWEVADSSTVDDWSAVGLHFAMALQRDLSVAIGLINMSQGSSTIAAWMTGDALTDAGGKPPPMFDDIRRHYRNPSVLNETMLSALVPYGLKGVVWYQGESDAPRGTDYEKRLSAMIQNWRTQWQKPDLPFLLVQLPAYESPQDASGTQWAELRAAQARTAWTVPGVHLAVMIDSGDKDDIHPSAKKIVGDRLGAIARANVYGETIPYRGPSPATISYLNDRVDVIFHYAEDGLVKSSECSSIPFSVLGMDEQWQQAQATVHGNRVSLRHPQEQTITGVRHAWSNAPEVTLYNVHGFPVEPFEDRKASRPAASVTPSRVP